MRYFIFIFLLLNGGIAHSQERAKLVVGITINQFYPEWLGMYGHLLSENGLKRLTGQGAHYAVHYNYLYSQTGVDHATIYTGLLPKEHGIVAHSWYERLKEKRVNNVVAAEYPEIGCGDTLSGFSPEKLQAMTLGCMMKSADAFSKVYSIGVNPEEAVLSGGTCADMALWLNEESGKWVSSRFYADGLPLWLQEFNETIESDFYVRRGWMALADEEAGKGGGRNRSNDGFFYDIMQAKRKYNTYKVLKATPYVNTLVTDLAHRLIKEENLGKDNDADLLLLNFTSLDYMNRDFGVEAREFLDMLLRLDREVEKLLKTLDENVGRGQYTLFLTFSEARELLPEELKKMRISSDYFSAFKAVALLKTYLNLLYGEGEWVLDYDAMQVYLNRALIDSEGLLLKDFQDKVADFLMEFEGVSNTLTADMLIHNSFPVGSEALVQNHFSRKQHGDVLYYLQPAWVPVVKDMEDFHCRYSRRNSVPLYFYGAGVNRSRDGVCNMTDIVPMVKKILNL